MSTLEDKVAIVTGGGSGIGAATALMLAKKGAKVVVVARRLDTVQAVADKITAAGGTALALSADIGEEDQIINMVEQAIKHFGRIDILHNNAALTDSGSMGSDGAIADMEADAWDRILRVNLRGPMLCSKYVIPHMLKQGGGSIIMSGSGKGIEGDLGQPAYGASKAGLINLTQNIATQYGKQGIRANIVVVGLVMTEGLDNNFPQALKDMMEDHHLTPYLGASEDIANAVAFLASDESRFITGQQLFADGGFTAHSPAVADLRRMMAAHAEG